MLHWLIVLVISTASTWAIPFGEVQNGDFTYYDDAGYGACGTAINAATQDLVAVSHEWYTEANPNNDPVCGGVCVRVDYNGKSITVPVKDKCAACDREHIDLSKTAFQKLEPNLGVGHVYGVQWQFVHC